MNRMTAAFLQTLYEYAPQKKELLERARQELLRQLERDLPNALSAATLFCSPEAQHLQKQIDGWKTRAERIVSMRELTDQMEDLEQLCSQEKRLHTRTQTELARPGFLNVGNLHILYLSEQDNALRVLNQMIQIDLFRIVALGGPDLLRHIPPLDRQPNHLDLRLNYYKTYIQPALDRISEADQYGSWAFCYQDMVRAGPLARLPAFQIAEPVQKLGTLLPGEYKMTVSGRGMLYQGVGRVTNITPETVVEAQNTTVQARITPKQLFDGMNQTSDPVQALQLVMGKRFYSVSAADLFAAADFVVSAHVIVQRGYSRQCFLCGQPVQGNAPLCSHCMEKTIVK